jgi:hypothetical protein
VKPSHLTGTAAIINSGQDSTLTRTQTYTIYTDNSSMWVLVNSECGMPVVACLGAIVADPGVDALVDRVQWCHGSIAVGPARPPMPRRSLCRHSQWALQACHRANYLVANALSVNLINSVNPVNPVDPVNLVIPVNLLNQVIPLNPLNPVNPVNPLNPVNPENPVNSMLNQFTHDLI